MADKYKVMDELLHSGVTTHVHRSFISKEEGEFVERLNRKGVRCLKGKLMNFDSVGVDVPILGESNPMGPKKPVEVKFFTRAFFWRAQRH